MTFYQIEVILVQSLWSFEDIASNRKDKVKPLRLVDQKFCPQGQHLQGSFHCEVLFVSEIAVFICSRHFHFILKQKKWGKSLYLKAARSLVKEQRQDWTVSDTDRSKEPLCFIYFIYEPQAAFADKGGTDLEDSRSMGPSNVNSAVHHKATKCLVWQA